MSDTQQRIILTQAFHDAAGSDNADTLSVHKLLQALKHRKDSVLQDLYGKRSYHDFLEVFTAMDTEGSGAITLEAFLSSALAAFAGVVHPESSDAHPSTLAEAGPAPTNVPEPPAVRRSYGVLLRECITILLPTAPFFETYPPPLPLSCDRSFPGSSSTAPCS